MAVPQEKLGKIIVRQLPTKTDLVGSIMKACADSGIRYAAILAAVGSLQQLRMEGVVRSTTTGSGTDFAPPRVIPGPLQLVNMSGIIFDNEKGEMDNHIHGSVVDTDGKLYGGHFMEGSPIATRLVVVIGAIADVKLVERYDETIRHRLLHIESL